MRQRVLGLEIEYAIAALRGGVRTDVAGACAALFDVALRVLPHLPGPRDADLFLQNGGRLYADVHHHPEACTPEVDHPDDLVRYWLAGEAILRDLVARITESEILLYRCNVDYDSPRGDVTWGLHENYGSVADPLTVGPQLVPHLVSRIYLCAGGLNPLHPGIQFSVSPRLTLFSSPLNECFFDGHEVSRERGIHNPRDEPLCCGYHRIHVICADSVNSHAALWLRVASTSLVVAMAEAGLDPAAGVQLKNPVAAMSGFLRDPEFQARAVLADGREATALDIQQHYLEQAEHYVDHPCMPEWAKQVCTRWREMLEMLHRDSTAAQHKLDWAMKQALFNDHIRRRGFEPSTLPHWNALLEQVCRVKRQGGCGRVEPEVVMNSELRRAPGPEVRSFMDEHDLCWERLGPLLELRDELCEIDVCYGQLAPSGIFDAIEPLLGHRMAGSTKVEEAMCTPPSSTRAGIRGAVVRELWRTPGCQADWYYIYDDRGRVLDLSDLFICRQVWSEALGEPTTDHMAGFLERCSVAYEAGNFEAAWRLLQFGMRLRSAVNPCPGRQWVQYLAWIQARRGYADEALAALEEYADNNDAADGIVRDMLVVCRFRGLLPDLHGAARWIERGDTLYNTWPAVVAADYLGHKGAIWGRCGRLAEGAAILERAQETPDLELSQPRLLARIMADSADLARIRGDRGAAGALLDEVDRIYARYRFGGERAEFGLTVRAKLEPDPDRARELLKQAARIQRRLSNPIGLTRTYLLDARLSNSSRTAARRRSAILELRGQCPDLASCSRLAHILAHWQNWANRVPDIQQGDYFWLL